MLHSLHRIQPPQRCVIHPKGKLSTESVTQPICYALGLRKEAELRKRAEEELKKSHVDLTLSHEELQASMEKLKKAQNQILRSEKLAGIGRMVAGVCTKF